MSAEAFDIRKVLETSTTKTTVGELARQGIKRVRVLDEATLRRLVREAVEHIVARRSSVLTEDERERISRESRLELERLIREHQEIKLRAELSERDRQSLIREVENLTDQLRLMRRMMLEEASRRYEEGVQSQQSLIAELRRRLQEHESQRRAQVPAGIHEKLEQLALQDEQMASQVGNVLSHMMDQITRRLDAIKIKVGAGEVALRPGDATLENILKEELESNLSRVGVKQEAGVLSNTLDKLRAMRHRPAAG